MPGAAAHGGGRIIGGRDGAAPRGGGGGAGICIGSALLRRVAPWRRARRADCAAGAFICQGRAAPREGVEQRTMARREGRRTTEGPRIPGHGQHWRGGKRGRARGTAAATGREASRESWALPIRLRIAFQAADDRV